MDEDVKRELDKLGVAKFRILYKKKNITMEDVEALKNRKRYKGDTEEKTHRVQFFITAKAHNYLAFLKRKHGITQEYVLLEGIDRIHNQLYRDKQG